MSSSSDGQWMPMPGPISSHCLRSAGVPSARRGYQASGTETTRPSWSATTSASAVTFTSAARGLSVAGLEVVMPRLHQMRLVCPNDVFDLGQLIRRKTVVVFQPNRRQPELRSLPIAGHMNVDGLAAIARKKEESIRTTPENRRTHEVILPAFLSVGHWVRAPATGIVPQRPLPASVALILR